MRNKILCFLFKVKLRTNQIKITIKVDPIRLLKMLQLSLHTYVFKKIIVENSKGWTKTRCDLKSLLVDRIIKNSTNFFFFL